MKRRRSDERYGAEVSYYDESCPPKFKPKHLVYTTLVYFLKESHNHEHDSILLQNHILVSDNEMELVAKHVSVT